MVEKLFPDAILKIKIEQTSGSTVWNVTNFILCPNQGPPKYVKTKMLNLLSHVKVFWRIKRGLELVSLPYFLHDFWRITLLFLCSINWLNFIVRFPLLREILNNMFIAIICYPVSDVIDFKINLIFLIKLFFLLDQKVKTKI